VSAISIALVDDHRVVASSLKAYLESFSDLRAVGIACSGEDLLENLDAWKPQIVLQDLLLPGGMDGIETTRRIMERAPATKVIALTSSTDEARMMAVLNATLVVYHRPSARRLEHPSNATLMEVALHNRPERVTGHSERAAPGQA
jgi:two-component system, NarL family, response regulator LiaR